MPLEVSAFAFRARHETRTQVFTLVVKPANFSQVLMHCDMRGLAILKKRLMANGNSNRLVT